MNKFLLAILLLIGTCCQFNVAYGQQETGQEKVSPKGLWAVTDSLLKIGYQEQLFPGASVTIYSDDTLQHIHYGAAKMEPQSPIDNRTKFQLGSIGKLITAIAVLQEVEKGRLDLNARVTEYLDFEETYAELTLHCLLTHTCGFNELNIGYLAKTEEQVLSLDEFTRVAKPGLFQTPGKDIVYSNFSYALAGLIVQKVRGRAYEEYVEAHIFKPLGMSNSTLEFPYGYQTRAGYANAYLKTGDGFEETKIYPRHATPAGSLVSTPEDMGLFIRALFDRDSTLLSQESWQLFYQPQFSNHALLNGYTYGLEAQNINGVRSYAKGGMLPGALSHLLVVPGHFAMFSSVNTNDDDFGDFFFKTLFDHYFPANAILQEKAEGIALDNYVGEYRNKRYNKNTEDNIISLFRGQFNLYTNSTRDTLLAYHDGTWHSYVPIQKDLFQNTTLPYEYLHFQLNEKGYPELLYRNSNIGGLTVPSSYEKTSWFNSPSFINEYYGIIPLLIFSGLIFLLCSLLIRLLRLWKKTFFETFLLPAKFHVLWGATIALFLLNTFWGPFQLIQDPQSFLFGYPDSFRISTYIGYLLIPLVIALGISIAQLYRNKSGKLITRIYLGLVFASMVIHLIFLNYWNFI